MTYTENGIAALARFVYDSASNVRGFILNDSAVYMYLKNAQGDVSAVVDESGAIVIRYTYNAWGETEFAVPSGVDPADTSIISKVSPFCYRGYCYDQYTGLYYLQSRYYDPETGRFINADDTTYLNATGTVLGCNLFAYCENDPVNNIDPKGAYSKSKAATYAQKWWNSYNPSYKANRGEDCANFVSQCLYAGNLCKMSGIGRSGWHHYVLYMIPTYNRWGSITGYKPAVWQISDAWGIAPELYKFLTVTKKFSYKKITTISALYSVINNKTYSIGDVAFFANGSNIYHAVLLGKTVNNKGKKNIYYFAHTSNRNGYNTSTKYGLKEVIYSGKNIYIVKIR